MRRLPQLRGRLAVSPLIARARVSPLLAQARLSPLMAIILGAAAFATLLSALFALYGLMGPTDAGTERAAPDWKPPTLAIVELNPPKPASADVQTLTRPIFSKTRKPTPRSAPRASEPVVTSSAPSGVTVSAIVKKGKTAQAFVVSPDAPEGAWKKIGDTLDSWTISDIASDALTLRSGGNAATVKLYADAPAEEPPPGAPGAPPPNFSPQSNAPPPPPPPGAPAPPPPPPMPQP